MNEKLFWDSLPTKVQNTLRRNFIDKPWDLTIKELMRVPGIGPDSLVAIAKSIQKHRG